MEEPIKIKSINLFSSWVYNLPKNTDCTICRCNLNLSSLYNQEKGIDSYVVSGACNHSFHYECIKPWVEKNNYCPICFSEWQYNKKPVEDPYTNLVDKIIIGNDEAQSIINDAQSIIDKYKNNTKSNNQIFESTLTDIKKMWANTGNIKTGTGPGYWAIHYNEDENGINKIAPGPEKLSQVEEKKFSSGPTGFSKKVLIPKSGSGPGLGPGSGPGSGSGSGSGPTEAKSGPTEPKSGTGTHPCNCVTCTGININEYINKKIKNKFKTINIDL
jgi:anaphase-promoting complex subunit 11